MADAHAFSRAELDALLSAALGRTVSEIDSAGVLLAARASRNKGRIGNVIEQEFTQGNNWHLGSGLSLVLMVFILISMAFVMKYDKDGEGAMF